MHVESEFFWKPCKCEEGHGCRDGQDDNAIQDHLSYEEAYTDALLIYKCHENKSEADACEALQISVPNDAYGLHSNRCGADIANGTEIVNTCINLGKKPLEQAACSKSPSASRKTLLSQPVYSISKSVP